MTLTCELGWHRADPMARWNDGYYFSKCTRCGCDLVRTAYQKWHVPKGYRVIWQAHPPEPVKPLLAGGDKAQAGAAALPIQEVLRHLESRDLENDGGVGCEDAPAEAAIGKAGGVDLASMRIAELTVGHVLVSKVEIRASEEQSEEAEAKEAEAEDPDPELPFEDALIAARPEEAAPIVEAPAEEALPSAEVAADAPQEQALPEFPGQAPPAPEQKSASRSFFDDFMAEDPDPAPWDAPPPSRSTAMAYQAESDRREELIEEEEEEGSDVPAFHSCAEDDPEPMPVAASNEAGVDEVDSIKGLDDDGEVEEAREEKVERPSLRSLFFTKPARLNASDTLEAAEAPTAAVRTSKNPFGSRAAMTALVAVIVLTIVAAVSKRPSSVTSAPPKAVAAAPTPQKPIPRPEARPTPPPQPALFPQRQKAFVTARILNCRASPVEQAGTVKKLSRGAEVEIIAREADWLSISHGGRQCWTAFRYISPDQPA